MNAVDSGRVVRTFTQRIEAPPERVFPLLCPVREGEWLEGWSETVEMVHSRSGLAEEGCVFVTRRPGRPETVWMITRHDPAAGVVDFHRVTAGLVATRLTIEVRGRDDGASDVAIAYAFTPLGPEGRAFVDQNHGEAAFVCDMRWWEDSLNHWLRTGELLRASARG